MKANLAPITFLTPHSSSADRYNHYTRLQERKFDKNEHKSIWLTQIDGGLSDKRVVKGGHGISCSVVGRW
jgi:hypothetical protein